MFLTENEVVTAPFLAAVERLTVFQVVRDLWGKGISSHLTPSLIVLRL